MNTNEVMELIQKHMHSMDYLSATPQEGALKSAHEASALLYKDLQKVMASDTLYNEEVAAEASMCTHEWKTNVNALWRHPLWSGR